MGTRTELLGTIQKICQPGKGILAADESSGTIGKQRITSYVLAVSCYRSKIIFNNSCWTRLMHWAFLHNGSHIGFKDLHKLDMAVSAGVTNGRV